MEGNGSAVLDRKRSARIGADRKVTDRQDTGPRVMAK
jgi:hypothetical protein